MDQLQLQHLEDMRRIHQKRLQILEQQAAMLGISAPPHILIEIEDIREEIAKIDNQLTRVNSESQPPTGHDDAKASHLTPTQLHAAIVKLFSIEEIKTLCMNIEVDYESLPGEGKSAKARELVLYCRRHDLYSALLDEVRRQRPNL